MHGIHREKINECVESLKEAYNCKNTKPGQKKASIFAKDLYYYMLILSKQHIKECGDTFIHSCVKYIAFKQKVKDQSNDQNNDSNHSQNNNKQPMLRRNSTVSSLELQYPTIGKIMANIKNDLLWAVCFKVDTFFVFLFFFFVFFFAL